MTEDWLFARLNPDDIFARLHHFSLVKRYGDCEIEYVITVHEHGPSSDESRRFVARSDRMTNQRTAPYRPMGWGGTLFDALSRCVREIHRFPYEGEDMQPAGTARREWTAQGEAEAES